MLKRLARTASISLATLAMSSALFAQATAGINGRVVDQGGAVLPGATVTVTNSNTGAVRTTVTNGEGLYIVPALEPGMYDVKAELSGFSPVERKGVELLTGSNLTVDVQAKLPFLAAYMGHVSIASTQHYLPFVDAIAAAASARFSRQCGALVGPRPGGKR